MKTNNIEAGSYVGYLWKSDENTPKVFRGEAFVESLDPSTNPFIIEGELFDVDRQISYSIKYVDGQYIIHRWDLKADFEGSDDFDYTKIEAQSHRMGGLKLYFHRYWKANPDPMCEGMKVLNPYALVFVGFND